MSESKDIYELITTQEEAMSQGIDISGWLWNFKDHVKTSFFYKHGRLLNGNDDDTPVKNITRPILNLQYRAEDIDVKDIAIYIDDPDSYHLSFLVKKYHDDVFVAENDIDTFLDEVNESKIDSGGGLCKKMDGARPEVIPLQSIAFCDQTDMLAGPIGFKLFFSPDQLKDMADKGWGSDVNGATITLDELITLADNDKKIDQDGVVNKTSGRNIEVYEVHGAMPQAYLDDSDNYKTYVYQMQIVAFYTNKAGEKVGNVLFRMKQKRGNLKLMLRDKIYSRALGFGGAEELFEPQVWTNYSVIRQKDLLDATSKIILKTTDPNITAKHPSGLKNVGNLEIIDLQENTDLSQIDTTPRSMVLFDKFEQGMKDHAQLAGGATDALLGETPTSGTPFKLQDLITSEGQGLHEYRREKFSKFIESIYQDWIIPYIAKEITNGTKFLSELSMDEMQYVGDCLVRNEVNKFIKEKILNGELIDEQEVEALRQKTAEDFARGGNKRFLEILKGEFNRKPLRVKVNVKGAQADLAKKTDKLVNIFRQIISNPQGFQQMMQVPELAKTFNQILEYSGLSPINFSGMQKAVLSPIQAEGSTPQLQTNEK